MPTSPDRDDGRGEVWKQRRLALGTRIRALRQERGLSQESLALESGLSRNMLIQVEWGQRGIMAERLGDIAEVLGVEIAELFVESGRLSREES
ncbi:MAG TPA: helix-turn-helix transcriptional regulator [Arachnia sp.]|nr:helix-turn-helix transcriptional regulator [Arachnia sp.]HMT84726.1 helix-turn-helix transcriptional regulator [Arachnia sp.]